jgi:predicted ferric reductase
MLALFTDGKTLWYAMRAAGVVLVVLLTASTAMGVFSTARAGSLRWPRFATQALHRNVSLLAMLMLAVHIVCSVMHEFVDIRWFDAVVPFIGPYQPLWVGLGAVATDLMIVIVLTSLVRERMQHRGWRIIHLTSYAAWVIGVVHGIGLGTDSFSAWGLSISAISIGVVATFGVVRLVTLAQERRLAA